MKNRKFVAAVNWIMLLSLILVFVSGMLLRPMPGMVLGITHALSGYVLLIAGFIHCVQHKMVKFKKKKIIAKQ